MFALSQTTGYAIQALTCIAGECSANQIRDIAACTDISVTYLAKVIHRLAKAGVLVSKRGNKGGIWLARDPEEITLLQISDAVEGGDQLSSCLLGLETCSDARACPAHDFWKPTRAAIRRKLEQTTLADVVAFEAARRSATKSGELSKQPAIKSTNLTKS